MTNDDSSDKKRKIDIEKARRLIAAIPRPEAIKLEALIAKLSPDLIKARKEGCSYSEIIAVLNQAGIDIRESTLRQYLSNSKRDAVASPDTKPDRSASKKAKKVKEEGGAHPEVDVGLEHIRPAIEPSTSSRSKADVPPVIIGNGTGGTLGFSSESDVSAVLQASPNGLIDNKSNKIITPSGKKLDMDDLPEPLMKKLAAAIHSVHTNERSQVLVSLMREIDEHLLSDA